jgi:hypothetical protein
MIPRMTTVLRWAFVITFAVGLIGPNRDGLLGAPAHAQGMRDRTRLRHEGAPTVAETQAAEITLTVAPVGKQLLQTWIRTAGAIDQARKTLTTCVAGSDGALINVGQRVRAFPPDSKSSIYQARVSRVEPRGDCIGVEATLSGPAYADATRYVMEVIVDRGQLLAVPNAAIIERDGKQIVYEQIHPGHYEPHEIRTGLKGETYSEVLEGIAEGNQIITIGSFFIDADYRLKMTPGNGMDAHHHH